MTSIRKVATGVAGLDAMLRGGIPEGRASLLAGHSGTGKTVLALQIAAHLARGACPVIGCSHRCADASDLSGLADAMLSIDLSNSHEGAIRQLRLVKSRGSAHADDPYRLAIERGGAVVTRMRDRAFKR